MYQSILDAIISELNTGQCLRDIANHWACRCTVPGPGMRQAAEILQRRYEESGAAGAEILPYPADDRTEFLDGHRNPLEWRPYGSSLAVAAPAAGAAVICRYGDEPLSLVCNSTGTPPEGITAGIVVRSGPLSESAVSEGEFAGKFLLSDQHAGTVEAAARKGRALGVVSDAVSPPWLVQFPPVREPEDTPDLVMWTIFSGRRSDQPLVGFNLSPRQGRRLRSLIAGSTEPVLLNAVVDAELVEGSSDLLHAVVPGTDLAAEEVWVLAHLSEPGARDNASGCCLSVEIARTLTALIAAGKLPPLRRTLRFMHAAEVSGFLPYIDAHRDRLPQVVAGLCLDSVGQDFRVCGGELVLFHAPEQNASFVDGLLETLVVATAAEPVARFSKDNYATLPWHSEQFWGNDAFVSDGFFDIPAPQVSCWPDKFYHSSQDTPDQMCDNTLGRVGVATGSLLYLLATAGASEARWFALLAAQDWKRRIAQAVTAHVNKNLAGEEPARAAAEIASLVRHMGLQAADAVTQAERFAPGDAPLQAELAALAGDVQEFAEREALQAARAFVPTPSDLGLGPARPSPRVEGEALVPCRLRWRQPAAASFSAGTRERLAALAKSEAGESDLGRIWPWINGRRTAREIHERLRHGGAIPLATVVEALRLLAGEGAVALSQVR